MNRPSIPIEVKRAVLVEAGHRCAIPTCRMPSPLEIAHIEPWSETNSHDFTNLICLCANCHSRYDKRQDGFDKQTMKMYKQNLLQIRNQYSDFENILFEQLVQQNQYSVILDDLYEPFLYYSLRDGIFEKKQSISNNRINGRLLGPFVYDVTAKGRAFLQALKIGKQIDL